MRDDELVSLLRADFPAHSAVLTHRGASALFLALDWIRTVSGSGEVILPSTVCPSVPLAVLYAGLEPRFCDVELSTFCTTAAGIEASIGPRTRAILLVHLFGKAADVEATAALAARRRLPLIADIAQAIGGEVAGRKLGSWADFTVASFAAGKIVAGGAGGALLVRDAAAARAVAARQSELPAPLPATARAATARRYRTLGRRLVSLLRAADLAAGLAAACARLWLEAARTFRPLLVARRSANDSTTGATVASYRRLAARSAGRREMYERYAAALSAPLVCFAPEEICWRLPVLCPSADLRTAALMRLRARGVLVSDHYFPCHLLHAGEICRNAETIGRLAINLCVDRFRPDWSVIAAEELGSASHAAVRGHHPLPLRALRGALS